MTFDLRLAQLEAEEGFTRQEVEAANYSALDPDYETACDDGPDDGCFLPIIQPEPFVCDACLNPPF